ncbi:MAG TPA: M48 family metallopeptidase [Clostridiaceae bacterium]|nr:M48 family metallopeptidase [Clostridiaceae bacterium]
MNKVKYNSKIIEYEIVRSKIKNLYIHVRDNKVIVKAPIKMKQSEIEDIVDRKKKWIYEKINQNVVENYKDGNTVKILGKDFLLQVQFLKDIKPILELNESDVVISLPLERKNRNNTQIIKDLINNLYMKIAEKEVAMAMMVVTRIVGIKPNKYRIKRLKTAWGTCTQNKNITINSELMKYDRQVIQYVVLHEICHLKYMNHSKEFWNMVEKYMKDYKEVRSRLK